MARISASKVTAPSRVRFIMLDAELNEGDLSQFTQAIQNALRPPTSVPSTPRAIAQKLAGNVDEVPDIAPIDEAVEEAAPQTERPTVQTRSGGSRKFRVPKVLDVDLTSGVAFASFAQPKNPPTDLMRFLVVAAWFKQHRNLDSITADHVYTCYRAIGWPSAIGDFSKPLRALKSSQLLVQTGRGEYAINHIGLAKVDKLGTT